MKKLSILLCGLWALILSSCEGSDTYRGSWNAISTKGEQVKIIFDAKSLVIKEGSGKTRNFTYKQYAVALKNETKTYRIELSDGTRYKIYFPDLDFDSTGSISLDNGTLLYTISKKGLGKTNDAIDSSRFAADRPTSGIAP